MLLQQVCDPVATRASGNHLFWGFRADFPRVNTFFFFSLIHVEHVNNLFTSSKTSHGNKVNHSVRTERFVSGYCSRRCFDGGSAMLVCLSSACRLPARHNYDQSNHVFFPAKIPSADALIFTRKCVSRDRPTSYEWLGLQFLRRKLPNTCWTCPHFD